MGSKLHIEAFSERLKILRRRKGLTQEDLAKEIGVSGKTLNTWEGGKFINGGGLKVANIVALCNALDCDFEYLFGKIDLPTKAASDIQDETGLSEQAIRYLVNMRRHAFQMGLNTVNALLSEPAPTAASFTVIDTINEYLNHDFGDGDIVSIPGNRGESYQFKKEQAEDLLLFEVMSALKRLRQEIRREGEN